jgi:hypothetical protein
MVSQRPAVVSSQYPVRYQGTNRRRDAAKQIMLPRRRCLTPLPRALAVGTGSGVLLLSNAVAPGVSESKCHAKSASAPREAVQSRILLPAAAGGLKRFRSRPYGFSPRATHVSTLPGQVLAVDGGFQMDDKSALLLNPRTHQIEEINTMLPKSYGHRVRDASAARPL